MTPIDRRHDVQVRASNRALGVLPGSSTTQLPLTVCRNALLGR